MSPPVEVPVILQCSTCESASCLDLLPAGSCMTCAQPDVCATLYETCFAPGMPGEAQASTFEAFLGTSGALWASAQSCAQGEALCQGVLDGGSCAI